MYIQNEKGHKNDELHLIQTNVCLLKPPTFDEELVFFYLKRK